MTPHFASGSIFDAQRQRAREILALFGLDRIYGDDSMPRTEGVLEIMNSREGRLETLQR